MDFEKVPILCVDDEPRVLEGMVPHLRRNYVAHLATSGAEALDILQKNPGIAVVVSDMRMPSMDGAELLARARDVAPDTMRILLTGQADVESAGRAVNDGQIFRFLTKPCPPLVLLTAIANAIQQREIVRAERVLLEQTLHGAVKVLTDVLALVSPGTFGRAGRVKSLASRLAVALELPDRWQLEVAAMVFQIGAIGLPPTVAEKWQSGAPLTPEEKELIARMPMTAKQVLGNLPRLEPVQEMLAAYGQPYEERRHGPSRGGPQAAQVLRVAVAFEGRPPPRPGGPDTKGYDPRIIDALVAASSRERPSRSVRIHRLEIGMVLAEDLRFATGALVVPAGFEVTERLLLRLRPVLGNIAGNEIRVLVPEAAE